MQGQNRAVELHDSIVKAIEQRETEVVLRLRVYLHVSDGRPAEDPGTGWTQQAVLTVAGGSVESALHGELRIIDGRIEVAEECFDNLLPIPFERAGRVTLRFDGAEGTLHLTGQAVSLVLLGGPEFVETFP